MHKFDLTAPEQNSFPVLQFLAAFDGFGVLLREFATVLCAKTEHRAEAVHRQFRRSVSVIH